ncbi:flagellar brake protein [Pelomonas sp. SE-A7]|uniref:flagellar brake protein n=1 Tax=Pelomonas sp. SE-A7 TaxID=3054953 RepID=UPI00259D129D|nr:flagellar brake protein [Pelomonas sp. SE-A7]MDM4764502.1 flagellar brake protein [Pelomonas sp. SE-A7]
MHEALPALTADVDQVDVGTFRLDSPLEIQALLRELQVQRCPLSLNTPEGETCRATVLAVDPDRGVIALDSSASPGLLRALAASGEIQAQAFLDNIRLQFEVEGLVLVQDGGGTLLQANLPQPLYRFQRRQAFRVATAGQSYPVAKLEQPATGLLRMRVLDISVGGVALLLPPDLAAPASDALLERVELELDRDTRLVTDLRLQHVSDLPAQDGAQQLGCAFVALPALSLRELQRFIDQAQKRRRLLNKA